MSLQFSFNSAKTLATWLVFFPLCEFEDDDLAENLPVHDKNDLVVFLIEWTYRSLSSFPYFFPILCGLIYNSRIEMKPQDERTLICFLFKPLEFRMNVYRCVWLHPETNSTIGNLYRLYPIIQHHSKALKETIPMVASSLLFFLKIHYDNRFIMLIVRRCAIAHRSEWKVDGSIAWLGCRPISGASVNQYWGSDSERGRLLVSL